MRDEDECGPFLDLFSFVDVLHHPADTPNLTPHTSTVVRAHQTPFFGLGFGGGYLFSGHFGIRFFDVRLAAATQATYLGPQETRPLYGESTTLEFAGVIFHARNHLWSYSALLTPGFTELLAGKLGVYSYGASDFFNLRAEVRGCIGRGARVCLDLSSNLRAANSWLNGGGFGLVVEAVPFD